MTGVRVILNEVKDLGGFFGKTLRMTGAEINLAERWILSGALLLLI